MANQIYIDGQVGYDLATDPLWDMPEEVTFSETLINEYVNQLMTTGKCKLFEEDEEPMTDKDEARKLVIEIMNLDKEFYA